jgi:hypothetical protein
MERALDEAVRRRAQFACEYCLMPQSVHRLRFPIDHIIARQHGGATVLENLALACGRCNRHKGPNLSGVDPVSGAIVMLFNPRRDRWADHFRWDGPLVVGISPQGRATLNVLVMNHPEDLAIRAELIEQGRGAIPPSIT